MQGFNGLSHKTKDFIRLYHQDGAFQDIWTQGIRDYMQNHEYQNKADHQASYPKVHEAKENIIKELLSF